MKSRTETTMRCQDSPLLPLVWRALESGSGSGNLPEADGARSVYAFPGTDRQHTPRGRPS
jgi:hypothetical protein